MSKNKTTTYTLLRLVETGYEPISGSNINKHGLPYFMKQKDTGTVICLDATGKSYRPMGPLVKVDFT